MFDTRLRHCYIFLHKYYQATLNKENHYYMYPLICQVFSMFWNFTFFLANHEKLVVEFASVQRILVSYKCIIIFRYLFFLKCNLQTIFLKTILIRTIND